MEARTRCKMFSTFQLLLVESFILGVLTQLTGNISEYKIASFDNPIKSSATVITRLDHFAVHQDTGEVFIGAVNYLYKFDKDLKQVANVSTATCYEDTCLNYNKILVLHDGRLITCGSEFIETPRMDQCQSRRLGDLVGDGSQRYQIVSYGMRSTASIVAPGKYNGNPSTQLYVAASYSSETSYQRVPPITRRLLQIGPGFMFADGEDTVSFTDDYTHSYDATPAPIGYVSAFTWKGFTYFATTQRQSLSSVHRSRVSKLIRLCHNTDDVDAYTEIFIDCSGSSGTFSLVQAAHVGRAGPHLSESLMLDNDDQVLYAVFVKASSSDDNPIADSALCVYKMSDIEAAFKEAVRQCLNQADVNEVPFFAGTVCNDQNIPDSSPYLCNAGNRYVYATGRYTNRVRGTSLVRMAGHQASSIITSTDLNHTVAFIGTTGGQLLKVHVKNSTSARLYEQVTLDDNPVMGDILLNETVDEVFLLTEQKFIKMRVENCGQYTTCEACIRTDAGNDGDPFCGWCTLKGKCTRYIDCQLDSVISTGWLPYNEAQCIGITQVFPAKNMPVTLAGQQIIVTVQKLPQLRDGHHYVCRFGDIFDYQATNYNKDSLACRTPPQDNLPPLPTGEDHVIVSLSVMSTETGVNFVNIDLNFYECGTHTSCVSCVGSDWACNWCVYENRCTHNDSICSKPNEIIVTGQYNQGATMDGPDACPQLQPQNGEVLIPNNVNTEITVNVSNFPLSTMLSRYQCSLNIEGVDQFVEATWDDSTVACTRRSFTYTSIEQELNATLSLWWTDDNNNIHRVDDRHGFTVTLYKCEVLRPDCSRCVSEETTRAELGCVWCGNTCGVMDSAVCETAAEIVSLHNGINCPDPVIMMIYPLFGPDEGNTIITLMASDLGRRFSDLREVTIGGQICDFHDLEMYYRTGASVHCRTRSSYDLRPQSIQASITGANGIEQRSHGKVTFQYKNPVLHDFSPKTGPQSGGTRIAIYGEFLDVGRNINVLLGSTPCLVERSDVNDSRVICQTSSVGQLGSWSLYVFFDGAVRFSQGQFTYVQDPVVSGLDPSTSILLGGRKLQVSGSGFSVLQRTQILVIIQSNQREFIEDCSVESDEVMHCISPRIDAVPNQTLSSDTFLNVSTGFIMDGVTSLRTWCSDPNSCTLLKYYPNPKYYTFDDPLYGYEDGIAEMNGDTLIVRGDLLDLAITNNEITVYVGRDICTDITLDRSALGCKVPQTQLEAGDNLGRKTSRNLPFVRVFHGTNVVFDIGYIRSPSQSNTALIVCLVSAVAILGVTILAVVLYKKSKAARREVEERRTDLVKMTIEKTEAVITVSGGFQENARK